MRRLPSTHRASTHALGARQAVREKVAALEESGATRASQAQGRRASVRPRDVEAVARQQLRELLSRLFSPQLLQELEDGLQGVAARGAWLRSPLLMQNARTCLIEWLVAVRGRISRAYLPQADAGERRVLQHIDSGLRAEIGEAEKTQLWQPEKNVLDGLLALQLQNDLGGENEKILSDLVDDFAARVADGTLNVHPEVVLSRTHPDAAEDEAILSADAPPHEPSVLDALEEPSVKVSGPAQPRSHARPTPKRPRGLPHWLAASCPIGWSRRGCTFPPPVPCSRAELSPPRARRRS